LGLFFYYIVALRQDGTILWTTQVVPTLSSPMLVSQNALYVQECAKKKPCYVKAFSLSTGNVSWEWNPESYVNLITLIPGNPDILLLQGDRYVLSILL
jgi:hypothetical protein